ncbi:glycosyltransferase [Streptomyces sp. NPDC018031]|uniref:glycosyltransferase n=1 Tax=Streptomyces sp. NPDC018031 TaxID=3365033 RepID=UPI0037A3C148
MRVGLLTEGGYPYASGAGWLSCDRLVRSLDHHEFEVYALSRDAGQHAEGAAGWHGLPARLRRIRTAALWGEVAEPEHRGAGRARGACGGCAGRAEPEGCHPHDPHAAKGAHSDGACWSGDTRGPQEAYAAYGRREHALFARHFTALATALCGSGTSAGDRPPASGRAPSAGSQADRFASGLYGLAELARDAAGLSAALRSERALRILERACHTPGAGRTAHRARVTDLLLVTELLERLLRPLSLDWYGPYHGAGGRPAGGRGRAGADRRPRRRRAGTPADTSAGPDPAGRPALDHGSADRSPTDRSSTDRGLAGVDLCHALSAGPAALPGLLAKRFFGTPLLVSEYDVRLRGHFLAHSAAPPGTPPARPAECAGQPPAAAGAGPDPRPADPAAGPSGSPPYPVPVRAMLAAFHRLLTAETYRQAALVTAGDPHVRRWQQHCGADRDRVRTVYPGVAGDRFAAVGEAAEARRPGRPAGSRGAAADRADRAGDDAGRTLLWIGPPAPERDVCGMLHAFAAIRRAEPAARLRIVVPREPGPGAATPAAGHGPAGPAAGHGPASPAAGHGPAGPAAGAAAPVGGPARPPAGDDPRARYRRLAARLFPDGTAGPGAPVSFEEIDRHGEDRLPELYAASGVVVLAGDADTFPEGLVEAMLCGRATVSTDAGPVREIIGGTGLVVPPGDPDALADACLALLGDPARRARLGAAARARALELFTTERSTAAFRDIYLDLVSHSPVRYAEPYAEGAPLPFARPAESRVPGRWTGSRRPARAPGSAVPARVPGWATGSRPPGPRADGPGPVPAPGPLPFEEYR